MRNKFIQPSDTFDSVDKAKIMRSGFDLSHRHTTTFDMGQVIPISLIEVIPGDVFDLGAEIVLRMQPLVAPIMHPVNAKIQAWFCPNRILTPDDPDAWERFITGGEDGTEVVNLPLFRPQDYVSGASAEGSLWDRFGCNPVAPGVQTIADAVCPIAFPWRFYTKLWNDWFRVPGIQDERDIVTDTMVSPFYENWPRDYFTSALPFLQRGISPSLPVLGSLSGTAEFQFDYVKSATGYTNVATGDSTTSDDLWYNDGVPDPNADQARDNFQQLLSNNNSLDITTNLSTVDTKQIRLAFLYQAFLEQMARGGARYAEMLPKIWGAKPLDMRLQRVEFIGGFTAPWLTSEVLQTAPQTDNGTSGDTTPQGTMAGHGINVAKGNIGRYVAPEHGFIMITACAYPDAAYQQGIPRSLLRRVREEFPSPAFAGLSEQEIFNAELYNQPVADDPDGDIGRTPFGYTGRFNEMRYLPSIVSSEMKSTFDYWHLGRKFASLPGLEDDFINMAADNGPENFKRIFAVQDVPGIVGVFGLKVHAKRGIPFMGIPATLGGA